MTKVMMEVRVLTSGSPVFYRVLLLIKYKEGAVNKCYFVWEPLPGHSLRPGMNHLLLIALLLKEIKTIERCRKRVLLRLITPRSPVQVRPVA